MYIRTTKVVTEDFRFDMPAWIELALAGNKIGAIKALKDATKRVITLDDGSKDTRTIGLLEAKLVVENVMAGLDAIEYSKRETDMAHEFIDHSEVRR